MLDAGYWMLDAGYWILDTGYWILDAGYWMLDAKCKIFVSDDELSSICYLVSSILLFLTFAA